MTDARPEPRKPDPRITEEDVEAAGEAGYRIRGEPADMRVALEAALRPAGLVARAIATELERIAHAAFELHATVGPAQTSISAVAEESEAVVQNMMGFKGRR